MSKFQAFIGIIGNGINYVIPIAFILIAGWIIFLSIKVNDLSKNIDVLLGGYRSQYKITSRLATVMQNTAVSKREDIYEQRKVFNGLTKQYVTITQLIPLFPMLGILGTVAGLFLSVESNSGDATATTEAIISGLGVALSTTFYGLLAAIILKIMETLQLTSKINELDALFEENEIRYSDAIAARSFSEDETDEK